MNIPEQAQVVIIGGGIIGCSIAYHLTKTGITDVVLLERKALTCGTTWHAAGLVGQLRATQNMTKLAQYTTGLLHDLEAETGQATGFKQNGSISVASNKERFEELKRGASMAKCFGLEVEIISATEIQSKWPLIHSDDLMGGVFLPNDGQTNPTDTTQAFAKGARNRGAKIFEQITVQKVLTKNGTACGVVTEQGKIDCEIVVNCAGMWAAELGRSCGVNIPLHAAEHFYIVTEQLNGATPNLPVLRDPCGYTYYKEEANKLLAGFFEPNAKPWGMKGIPENFEFGTLPEDYEHLEPAFEKMLHRVPALENAGIKLFFNGPESFTPDDRYLLGETPELKNFYVGAGFNSIGIQSSGGAGYVLAEWIKNGAPPMDLWDVDVARAMLFQNNRSYLRNRTTETLGHLYALHYPFYQFETGRNVRTSPLHERFKQSRACFGEAFGWERPNWFAPEGIEPRYEYSYKRQNWFEYSQTEHRAVRENVGILDLSSFAKYLIQGKDAVHFLNRICGNQIDTKIGKIVYTQLLNKNGGIEGDVTVMRLENDSFYMVDAAPCQTKNYHRLRRLIAEEEWVTVTDVTSGYGVLAVMGPNSRQLLQKLTDADLSSESFPFGTFKSIDFALAKVRAARVSYVGSLGWELHLPTEFTLPAYDALLKEGAEFSPKLIGFHAVDSLRVEKGYRHWGHELSSEDTPIEAGLGFALDWKKEDFIGRNVLLKQKENGVSKRLALFALTNPEPLLYHNEPIIRNGSIVGYISSGAYSPLQGTAIGMGYLNVRNTLVDRDYILSGDYQVEIAGIRHSAKVSLKPFFDPNNTEIKS